MSTIDPRWTTILERIPASLVDPRDYPRILFTLEGVAMGKPWADLAVPGISRPEWVMLKHRSPEFALLAKEAEKLANEVKKYERLEEAHNRAVKGEPTPTVDRDGHIVDWYHKRSDRLLEMLMKADDPSFRDSRPEQSGAGRVVLQVNFQIPRRNPQPATVNAEIEEVVDADRPAELERGKGNLGEDGAANPRPGAGEEPVQSGSGLKR